MMNHYLRTMLLSAALTAASATMLAETQPFTLPVDILPTPDEFARFTTLNANGDAKEWNFDKDKYELYYSYNSSKAADDWIFIPVTVTAADTYLKVSLEALSSGANSWYWEHFELATGTEASPEAMTVVMKDTKVDYNTFTKYETFFPNETTGTLWLGIHATTPKGEGRTLRMRNIKMENFATPVPLAPAIKQSSIKNLDYSATVTMPSSTLQGKNISGKVGLRMSVDGTIYQTFSDIIPGADKTVTATLTKGKHTISYTAFLTTGGQTTESDPVSEEVTATDPSASYTLPFSFEPTKEQFEECPSPIDVNGDGTTWQLKEKLQRNSFYYGNNRNNVADDWIFLPPVNFGTADKVTVSVEALAGYKDYPEAFEIWLGREASVNAMTVKAIDVTDFTKDDAWATFENEINAKGGIWYVGLHAKSQKDMYGLYLSNIKIETPGNSGEITADYTLPFEFKMDSPGQFGKCTQPEGDGGKWAYSSSFTEHGPLFCQDGAGDEWLFLPAVDFTDTERVKINVSARPSDPSYDEGFEIWLGNKKNAEAMTDKIMYKYWPADTYEAKDFEDCETVADIKESGAKYVGIHIVSHEHPKQTWGVFFQNLLMTKYEGENPGVGIEGIDADSNEAAEYYSLQGLRIANPEKGQMVIVRKGNKTFKAIL